MEVVHAHFSRAHKHAVEVRDFSRTEQYLNVHVQFSTTSSTEVAIVKWKAIKAGRGDVRVSISHFHY